jgi:uncharacterized membrane protein YphA (DoxX/SURF4 family)
MNGLTRFFLVLLRLAIGWHFVVEGVEKIHSVQVGPTETSRPWTSEPYLREASGPLAGTFRSQFGDPDEAALDRLTLLPPDEQKPAAGRLSPALSRDWDAYVDRFCDYYHLDEAQRTLARAKLDESKANAVQWLLGQRGSQEVKKSFPSGTVEVKETPAQRIEEYRAKLRQLRDAESKEMPAFERDVWKQKLRSVKADVARMRTSLLNDVNTILKEPLRGVLNEEQRKLSPLPDAPQPHWWQWARGDWITAFVVWGTLAAGLVLLLSLFGEIGSNHGREYARLSWSGWTLCVVIAVVAVAGVSAFLGYIIRRGEAWSWTKRLNWLLVWAAATIAAALLVSLVTRLLCESRRGVAWSWRRWLLAWVGVLVGAGLCLGLLKYSMLRWEDLPPFLQRIAGGLGLEHYSMLHWADWIPQEWLDWLVTFGLTAVGVCLLLGLLTRSACVGGALLLLMFYLTMPALPWVPDSPRSEGHYLFINKNLIEMLALLTLATTASGRWAGLDGVLRLLNPVRWFVRPVQPAGREL